MRGQQRCLGRRHGLQNFWRDNRVEAMLRVCFRVPYNMCGGRLRVQYGGQYVAQCLRVPHRPVLQRSAVRVAVTPRTRTGDRNECGWRMKALRRNLGVH